jgi:uncharacterized membrane protein YhaH (DUF805 family)
MSFPGSTFKTLHKRSSEVLLISSKSSLQSFAATLGEIFRSFCNWYAVVIPLLLATFWTCVLIMRSRYHDKGLLKAIILVRVIEHGLESPRSLNLNKYTIKVTFWECMCPHECPVAAKFSNLLGKFTADLGVMNPTL